MAQFDIFAVTTCLYDMTSYAPRYPKTGESVQSVETTSSLGGKGANQAVQAALLGAKVAVIGKIGKDIRGSQTRDQFNRLNINTDHLSESDSLATGTCSIVVDTSTGEGHTVVVRGANQELNIDDIVLARKFIENSRVLLCTCSPSIPAVYQAMQIAKSGQAIVLLNAAPIVKEFDAKLLDLTDILCVNEDEAEFLSGVKIATIFDAAHILEKLLKKHQGISVVVITLGAKGCVFCQRGFEFEIVPAPRADVVDTTGAGDSFVGALAFFLTNHSARVGATGTLQLKNVIERCCQVASLCVAKKGAQASYSGRSDLPVALFE